MLLKIFKIFLDRLLRTIREFCTYVLPNQNEKPENMKTLTIKSIRQSRTEGYYSDDLREQLLSQNLGEDCEVINLAYTDYGGDFFQKVAIEYFETKHPDSIVSESTGWNGKNAFIFGDIAQEFKTETERYLLGFESIEDFFTQKESEEQYQEATRVIKENPGFKFKGVSIRKLANWFSENASVQTKGVDYSWDRMVSAITNNEVE